ncbi:MAG: hypothetical protein OES99_07660, partial [Gammaproteobacteria bacterium]|nr:hypothetical protein [Gammaproteobacteria bacterium]
MNLVRYRNAIVVAVVATYLLLNYGMQVVKIPPGRYGVPVGELCLVFALVFCRHRFVLPLFASTGVFWAFGAWWFLGAMHLIRAVPEHGFWAFRDASQLIESGFLYLGFCLSVSEITRLKRWVPWFLAVAVLYGLTYPVREPLQALSPLIQTSSGREAFLFFSYISSSTLLVLASFMLIMYAAQVGLRERFLLIVLAALLLSFTVYAYQQRTIYLQIASLVLLSAALNARFRRLLPVIFGSFVVVLAVFPYLGINLQSRLGIDAGLGFIGNHLLAIAGIGSEGLEGAAGGVGQRLGWWYSIYLKVSASWFTGLFGLGYGQPLIDFIGHGVVVREPHNSIVTAF